jgi:hypothetical protein
MINLNKLNGWQRLWVFCSVLYFFFVLIFILPVSADILEEMGLYKEIPLSGKEVPMEDFEAPKKQFPVEDFELPIEDFEAPDDDFELPESYKTDKKFDPDSYPRDVVQNKSDFYDLFVNIANLVVRILFSLIFWFVPVVLLYSLGLSISWVRKGFNQK